MYGRAVSDWHIDRDRFIWTIVVPPNTTATAYVPATEGTIVQESGRLAEESDGVTLVQRDEETAVYRVVSGKYTFVAKKVG